jgi:tRNA pseudouridine38-40 synthase
MTKIANHCRYKLIVSYDGTRYKGFQRQSSGGSDAGNSVNFYKRRRYEPNGKTTKTPLTIQECIEDALEGYSGLNRTTLKVRFAGRTDAGVHAREQVLAVTLPVAVTEELWQIQKSINSRLPFDISIDRGMYHRNARSLFSGAKKSNIC